MMGVHADYIKATLLSHPRVLLSQFCWPAAPHPDFMAFVQRRLSFQFAPLPPSLPPSFPPCLPPFRSPWLFVSLCPLASMPLTSRPVAFILTKKKHNFIHRLYLFLSLMVKWGGGEIKSWWKKEKWGLTSSTLNQEDEWLCRAFCDKPQRIRRNSRSETMAPATEISKDATAVFIRTGWKKKQHLQLLLLSCFLSISDSLCRPQWPSAQF